MSKELRAEINAIDTILRKRVKQYKAGRVRRTTLRERLKSVVSHLRLLAIKGVGSERVASVLPILLAILIAYLGF